MPEEGLAEQWQRYVEASHRTRNGGAVLTNGNEWWIYDLTKRGSFENKRVEHVNILSGNRRASAQVLSYWLGRVGFG